MVSIILALFMMSLIVVLLGKLQLPFVIQIIVIMVILSGLIVFVHKISQIVTYTNIVKTLTVPAVMIRNEKIISYNQAGAELLHVEGTETLTGTSVFNVLTIHNENSTFEQGRLCGTIRHPDSELEVELNVCKINGQNSYIILLQELSETQQQLEKLQHVDQLSIIGELAAGVAHEIRNPITSLKGFLQLLEQNNSSQTSYVGIMLSEIERINAIVGELLLIAKPRGLMLKEKNLIQVLNTVVTLMTTQAIIHNIQIKMSFSDSSIREIIVNCDENKLKQVFINIIKNAIEAMKTEGEITVAIEEKKDVVTVSVQDQGEGMSEERLAQLGKTFFTTKQGGTGLGVMISSKIVEDHDGQFLIESELGKGTKISITLPYKEIKRMA